MPSIFVLKAMLYFCPVRKKSPILFFTGNYKRKMFEEEKSYLKAYIEQISESSRKRW